jgi:hypothetical protein
MFGVPSALATAVCVIPTLTRENVAAEARGRAGGGFHTTTTAAAAAAAKTTAPRINRT